MVEVENTCQPNILLKFKVTMLHIPRPDDERILLWQVFMN